MTLDANSMAQSCIYLWSTTLSEIVSNRSTQVAVAVTKSAWKFFFFLSTQFIFSTVYDNIFSSKKIYWSVHFSVLCVCMIGQATKWSYATRILDTVMQYCNKKNFVRNCKK